MRMAKVFSLCVGIFFILAGALNYYIVWNANADDYEYYKLYMAGRSTTSLPTTRTMMVEAKVRIDGAKMWLAAGVVVGGCLTAYGVVKGRA